MNWKGKRVLITGAGGFIGSHLAEELYLRGADVRAMVHYNCMNSWGNLELLPPKAKSEIKVIAGDVRDLSFMKRAVKDCDFVFHLAALIAIPYSYLAPLEYIKTNVEGTGNVMKACLDEGVGKIVHTSTSEVYGTAKYTPIDEKHPLQAQSPYSASKIGGDAVAMSFYNSFNLPVATLRPFNTYGGRQSARAVIPTIISQMLTTKTVKLGSLKPVRDFTYISDTVEAFIKVAESKKTIGEVVNSGTGKSHSIGDIVEFIGDKLLDHTINYGGNSKFGKTIVLDEARVRPEKSEVMELRCDNRKIRRLAGWKPKVKIEYGLGRTLRYIKEHLDRYKPNLYNV
jgi:NAD dependent epimerase/dehydratase